MLTDLSAERQAWLELMLLDGVGPRFFQRLRSHAVSPFDFMSADLAALAELGVPPSVLASLRRWRAGDPVLRERFDLALDWLQQDGCRLLFLDEPDYPPLLASISDPPPLLFVRGRIEVLHDPQIAMVGTRHPSPLGAETAQHFARAFCRSGLTVTSGMALGIDGACHRGALDAGGQTVAVWGTGLERCYPRRHRKLADSIVDTGGALVSELWPDSEPHPAQFPRRNRIISGLSLGTLVVEASLNSGSLITARMALEQNREVFAMPGSIHNVQARGCHRLLREGACLVEQVQDVLDALKVPLTAALEAAEEPATEVPDTPLWRWLGFDPVSPDWLAQRAGISMPEVLQQLLELELAGAVLVGPAGYCRRQP
ncbi:DNA-processing protein DprA [Halopseudomonas oceani]|uniref:DNA-processing protein DprA n=1 Tax=Halopseudomonas oceani TaxID=1708783 RepID=UPI002AA60EE5|nr:DNA-processing protein DprA [Halopseudomonas oceani]